MSDNPVLKIYETQAELERIKEEMKEIQEQNNQLKNETTFRNLVETGNEVQSKLDVLSTNVKEMQQAFAALSDRVSDYDEKFFEMNENLRKLNEKFKKYDVILSQHNDVSVKQNETTQVLNTNENNLGNRSFILSTHFQEKQSPSEDNEQSWKRLNIRLPYAIQNHGAQFLNNNLHIFGGYGKGGYLNFTYKLSESSQWEKMADMHQNRSEISNSSVILNDKIWVCGGYNKEEQDLKSVQMYDPRTNKWKYMKEMNECRSSAAATIVNGKIFCCGGHNRTLLMEYEEILNPLECYDPSSDVWTGICNIPQKIDAHGAVEMDGRLIVIGKKNVWTLDTTDKDAVWIEKPSLFLSRTYFGIAKIDNKIFICGGRGGFDIVEIFDGEVWRNGPKIPDCRHSAPAVVIPIEFGRGLEQFIPRPSECPIQ